MSVGIVASNVNKHHKSTKRYNNDFSIDLNNIDTVVYCEYVLTSPRSLQACKIVNIKPVELLYKSVEECAEELENWTSEHEILKLHDELEQDRLEKLKLCRMTRDLLISSNKETRKKIDDTSDKKAVEHRVLSINNDLGLMTKKKENQTKNENINYKEKEYNVLHLKGGGKSSNYSDLSTSTDKSSIGETKMVKAQEKCFKIKQYQDEVNNIIKSRKCENSSSSVSQFSSQCLQSGRQKQGERDEDCSSSRTGACTVQSQRRFVCSRRRQPTVASYSCENLTMSDHDRKILNLLALKREIVREDEEFAMKARQIWEADREYRNQLSKEQERQWKEYVEQKRRMENAENLHRWQEKERKHTVAQKRKENEINKKLTRAENRYKEATLNRMLAIRDRNLLEARKKAEAELAVQCMETEAELSQINHEQVLMTKLLRAENVRQNITESTRKRVASANRLEEMRHQEMIQRRELQEKSRLEMQREICRSRETRSCDNYQFRVHQRDMLIRERSIRRELKLVAARTMQEELDHGLEQWKDKVLNIQMKNQARSEIRVNKMLEWKRKSVSNENFERERHHGFLIQRVMAENKEKETMMKQAVRQKDFKIKTLKREKELAIKLSRRQALNTAGLREDLRRTLSPETFDRKVRKVELEVRASGKAPSDVSITRSHIRLG